MNKLRLEDLRGRLLNRLERLYGDRAFATLEKLTTVVDRYRDRVPHSDRPLWDERDIVLITYGDQITSSAGPAVRALDRFLGDYGLRDCFSCVHLLPFFPYSSDDGFSVIDYLKVDPTIGDWPDIEHLGQTFDLMADLVLNHISARSEWFQQYLAGNQEYADFFIEVDPQVDLSAVVRPRSLPLLTRFETSHGIKHVWTTFSEDQIDLNYACPDVLIRMVDILLFYLSKGARIIRLDAIAFLWKEIGTSCLHLPQTHEVVKLFRDIIDHLSPTRILLTETNVPHLENISYFGDGDEARMVYQFSLAPLLLDALVTGDAVPLRNWLETVCESAPGTTYLNFTASHDGIGVRPLQGLVLEERLEQLIGYVQSRGGHVSTRRLADGTDSPYELNITYFSALEELDQEEPRLRARRFLTSQAVMLALRGVPAVYFHSLVGTPNDHDNVTATGRPRSINRRKFEEAELRSILDDEAQLQRFVFLQMKAMLQLRRQQPAFHPEARQEVLAAENPAAVAFQRTSFDSSQTILVAFNTSNAAQSVPLEVKLPASATDLLTGKTFDLHPLELQPYEVVWLTI